jgi:membrane protein
MEPSGGVAALLSGRAAALVRLVLAHNLLRLAAALTYYTVLSLLPALLVVVSILGLIGLSPETVDELLDAVGDLGARWLTDFVSSALDSVLTSHSSGLVLGLSTLFAVWAASGYVGAFMWAADTIHGVSKPRPFWRELPLRVGLALLVLMLLAATAAALAVVDPVGSWMAAATGIGNGPLHLWSWIKWPLLVAVGLLMFCLLYRFGPAQRQPGVWRLLAGAATALVLWLLVSMVFGYYLTHWASYSRVYGALATGIAFLVWAWLLNVAVLAGAEVERALGRQA